MIDLVPEFVPPMIGDGHIGPHPSLLLVEESGSRPFETVAVPIDERSRDRAVGDRQVGREAGAGREPDQVVRIGDDRCLVKIVDAPDQPRLGVAPGAEILQMQIADRQYWRGLRQLVADAFDPSRPAEISGPQEDKGTLAHAFVLLLQVGLDNTTLVAQPGLVFLVVADKRHRSHPRPPAVALGTLSTARLGTLWQVRNIHRHAGDILCPIANWSASKRKAMSASSRSTTRRSMRCRRECRKASRQRSTRETPIPRSRRWC